MTRFRKLTLTALVPALLLLLGAELVARAAFPEDPAVKLTLRKWANKAGGASEVTGTASQPLRPGGSAVVNAAVGYFDERGIPRDRFCGGATFTGPPVEHLGDYPYLWTVSYELLEAETGRIVLDLSWARYESEREGEATVAFEETRTVTLREEEFVILDFLRAESYGVPSRCPGSVLLDLTVEIVEQGELAAARIPYDMWLLAEPPEGEPTAEHLAGLALQGHLYPFPLSPLRISLPGEPAMDAVGVLQGDFRARLRPDGSTDLVVEGDFMWGLAPPGEEPRGFGGNPVELTIENLAPGESLKILLPSPAGYATYEARGFRIGPRITERPVDPATGIARQGRSARIDLARHFEGYTFSLVVTPRAAD